MGHVESTFSARFYSRALNRKAAIVGGKMGKYRRRLSGTVFVDRSSGTCRALSVLSDVLSTIVAITNDQTTCRWSGCVSSQVNWSFVSCKTL